jgi:tricorn protease
MRAVTGFFCVAAFLAAVQAPGAISARMLRFPDVSATDIAFVYAGDIWVVPKSGGLAHRLSTPEGEESFPRFSPDGSLLAYTADYDGNEDIYVVPVGGGVPTRITHDPSPDRMLDWYPDGKSILFASSMESGKDRFNQLYRVSKDGGLPDKLPVPYGEFGAISPDGKTLAYMPIARDFRTWKRYRGGMAPDIWLFDLTTYASKNITNNVANDSQPMWHGGTLYFLSDRDAAKRFNLWAYDVASGAVRELTHFTEYDVEFPAIGPADIVFQNGDRLYLFDLATETTSEVKVDVVTDRATLKPHDVGVAKLVASATISPSGKRAILAARGDLFSLPAEHGPVFDLTNTSGSAERWPAWSPDGKSVAYFSDASGEYELWVRPADGSGEARKITSMGPGFRYNIFWSPDSKQVAFVDQAMRVNLCDVASGAVRTIDKGKFWYEGDLESKTFSWSADSRWLAYTRDMDSRTGAVVVYDTKDGVAHQVTAGYYNMADPVFDPEGKYLYVLTNQAFKPDYSDIDGTWIYPNSTEIAAIPLRKDVASPLAPRNDVEEGAKAEKKDEKTDHKGKGKGKKEEKKAEKTEKTEPKPVVIDFDGFEQRLVMLPPEAGNYRGLAAAKGKVIYQRAPRTGASDKASPILYFDLKERKEEEILSDADGFELSADGAKMLVKSKEAYAIVDVAAKQKMDKTLAVEDMRMTVDPPAEWRQVFNDVWRFERDFFYDPNMHGVNWAQMRERYGKLLDDAVTRWDVNFVIGELIAELNSSHTYRGGGDLEHGKKEGVGLLGADFLLENGAYRITRILSGAPWDSEVRSPLQEPGVDVKQGDYLLAVNHLPIDTTKDPWAAFQGLAEETVLLTVNDKPTMVGARDVLVKTLKSEYRLRNLAWINANRERVEKASGGRIGYVYVPDTGINGQNELVRQFSGAWDKEGLIIDERFNSGGQIPDRFVELLNRPILAYWAVRDGRDWRWPPVAHHGPTVMLINGWSGSGGDCFPFFFREEHVGPLIGTRTWGGLIGISGAPGLIDGGGVTVPTFSIYSTDGRWIVEGHGVDPDIEVVDDPTAMAKGGDPQLERAIEEVMRSLKSNPPTPPKRPAYTNRAGV